MEKEKQNNLPTSGTNLGGGILRNKKKDPGRTEKKILLGISVICFLILIIGITYAYIAYYTNQKGINVLETDCVKIEMEDLSDAMNLVGAYPMTDEQGYNTKPYRFSITNTCNVGVDYHVNLEVLDIPNRMSSKNVAGRVDEYEKKVLTSEISATPTYEGEDGKAIESYTLYTSILMPGETKSHSVRVWLDESAGNDAQNKSFYSKVVIEAIQNQIAEYTFSEYIIDQSKSQDRGIEVVEHEATEQTPALIDYRYTGSNPDNYVYFGCSDNCTEENLYRIIGVIPTQSSENGEYENRIKLIKASEYIGPNAVDTAYTPSGKGYRWSGSSTNKSNDWTQSTLNTEILNTNYWNSLGEYQKYIELAKWYLGATPLLVSINSNYNTSEEYYKEERSNTQGYSKGVTSYIDNVGLMYPSDYGYSISKEYWNDSVYNYREEYKNNAWLYTFDAVSQGEYILTPETNSNQVIVMGPNGNGSIYPYQSWAHPLMVRPTFYLKSSVMYGGGSGTLGNPYMLSLW